MTKRFFQTACIAAMAMTFVACDKSNESTSPSAPASTNAPQSTAKANPDFEKLQGRWERPDGGYVLEIRGADAEGKLDAAYYNPSPINVSRALAYREGGATKVFVELRDVNYPGCTYKLQLDPKTDQLTGEYYQATMQQTYEIAFVRLK